MFTPFFVIEFVETFEVLLTIQLEFLFGNAYIYTFITYPCGVYVNFVKGAFLVFVINAITVETFGNHFKTTLSYKIKDAQQKLCAEKRSDFVFYVAKQ